MLKSLANFLLFQCCWFTCVIGAGDGRWEYGAVAVILFTIIQFLFLSPKQFGSDIRLISVALILGIIADGFLLKSQWIQYAAGFENGSEHSIASVATSFVPPIWILSLWIAFALTVNHSMSWSKRLWQGNRKWVVIMLGAIFGPLAFLGGESFGAVVLQEKVNSLAALAVIWGMSFPLLVYLAIRFENQHRHA